MHRRIFALLIALFVGLSGAAIASEIVKGEDALPSGYRYVLAEGYIYYCVQTKADSFTLFRMKEDGTGTERIQALNASSFAISSGYLFFDDNTEDSGIGLSRIRLDGTDMALLYPNQAYSVKAAGDFVYAISDDATLESCILRFPYDVSPADEFEPNSYFVDINAFDILPVSRPYEIAVLGGSVFFTAYEGDALYLGLLREGATTYETLFTQDDLGVTVHINLLGFEGDTLYFGTSNEPSGGFMAAWTAEGGVQMLDIPQAFAYSDGYFYSSSANGSGISRCRADGSGDMQVTDQDLIPIDIQGDWLFARIGGGLNAEAVMLPKDGSAPPVTVPGFGTYDYEAHAPAPTPAIEWQYETHGEGTVALEIATHEQSACYRLLKAVDGVPGDEVMRVMTGPYTRVTLRFAPGDYILKIAKGNEWISDEVAFGNQGDYTTTKVYTFTTGTYEIKTGMQGDFYQDNASGFIK